MTAVAVMGFLFYTSDSIWERHKPLFTRLMKNGASDIGGERFVLAPYLKGDICYIVGIPMATANSGVSIPIENVEEYRERAIHALSEAKIILPMSYGPRPYVYLSGGIKNAEDFKETEQERTSGKESDFPVEIGEAFDLV